MAVPLTKPAVVAAPVSAPAPAPAFKSQYFGPEKIGAAVLDSLDYGSAPWMKPAVAEFRRGGKGVQEDYRSYKTVLAEEQKLRRGLMKSLPADDRAALEKDLRAARLRAVKEANPEINKYFDAVTTPPDKRGREYHVSPVVPSGSGLIVTPWCAAFVGWCIRQVYSEKTMEIAHTTAISWTEFGIGIAHPKFGCVAVKRKTGGNRNNEGTGHVGFFWSRAGEVVYLLGGNQNDGVNVMSCRAADIVAWRWPAMSLSGYLAGNRDRTA
ncbi:TIGR02594 family protein [Methylobrevis albus]|uniref:TIGR02594 family protein n=1 Tax=Methylobrevis albus TaxID=2793297 RepID=A0A931MYR7_9HYPH|nr:TIGR02594 family protein [Methylobrevis albus]MBH0238270.1 TIGR02594 family protein [Methylobrevis albus]